jgi:hypothetical protein
MLNSIHHIPITCLSFIHVIPIYNKNIMNKVDLITKYKHQLILMNLSA